MADKIVYNEEHINGIIKEYSNCVTLIEEVMTDITDAENAITTSYEGKAIEGLVEFYKVLSEHIDLFQQCCLATIDYIQDTLELMILLDESAFYSWDMGLFGGNDE